MNVEENTLHVKTFFESQKGFFVKGTLFLILLLIAY